MSIVPLPPPIKMSLPYGGGGDKRVEERCTKTLSPLEKKNS
jgi:hypothetical protein